MGTPDEPTTGFLIWRLSTKWRADVDRALAPLGLTHAQFSVLAALAGLSRQDTRPNQRQLADFTGLEPLYVSRLARALEAAGLVERPTDPADPRAVRLVLTERGQASAAEAVTTVRQRHAELTEAIGGPDGRRDRELRETLLTLLNESEPDMTTPRALDGRDINIAAAATRAVLTVLLDEAGLTFDQSVALRLMAIGGPGARDEVAGRDTAPGADRAAVRAAITELEATGLAAGDERVELTERGRELLERVTAATLRASDRLFEGIPTDDVATTSRVLDLITERAVVVRADLAGQAL
ncbi:MarR family transcriptional regulator [Actinophytocola sp.]|uniref:MarR family transcriptional regulator n=1 Tax=Actinophytocola sp. TaxID=1872138 RepID=UPI003D6C53D3